LKIRYPVAPKLLNNIANTFLILVSLMRAYKTLMWWNSVRSKEKVKVSLYILPFTLLTKIKVKKKFVVVECMRIKER
jgi:hypothetical protein